jgi:hypothetical protein
MVEFGLDVEEKTIDGAPPRIELRATGAPCPQRAVAECLAADSLMHSTGRPGCRVSVPGGAPAAGLPGANLAVNLSHACFLRFQGFLSNLFLRHTRKKAKV